MATEQPAVVAVAAPLWAAQPWAWACSALPKRSYPAPSNQQQQKKLIILAKTENKIFKKAADLFLKFHLTSQHDRILAEVHFVDQIALLLEPALLLLDTLDHLLDVALLQMIIFIVALRIQVDRLLDQLQ